MKLSLAAAINILSKLKGLGYRETDSYEVELAGRKRKIEVVLLDKPRERKASMVVVVDRRVHYWEWFDHEARLLSNWSEGWRILEVLVSPSGFAGDMIFLQPREGDRVRLAKFYYGEKADTAKRLDVTRVYVDAGRCYVIQPANANECGPFAKEYRLIEETMDECIKSRDLVTSVYGEEPT